MTKLPNNAPIVVTWIPRTLGAQLPDGKNSELNYLDILIKHKQEKKEERDIYLVVNGPGFKPGQIEELKDQLKEVNGIHVVDLHEYDWSEIDKDWKMDGNLISLKQYYKDMYNMTDEQRTYFAIEIDTFRLAALALLEQFTKQKGGIYVDFDSLSTIDGHIGKDITIPKGILLGDIDDDLRFNNDLIVINESSTVISILDKYKGEVLSQKEMFNEIENTFINMQPLCVYVSKVTADELEKILQKGIQSLYKSEIFKIIQGNGMNLGQHSIRYLIEKLNDNPDRFCSEKWEFRMNGGNVSYKEVSDSSWTKENLFHEQKIENELEDVALNAVKENDFYVSMNFESLTHTLKTLSELSELLKEADPKVIKISIKEKRLDLKHIAFQLASLINKEYDYHWTDKRLAPGSVCAEYYFFILDLLLKKKCVNPQEVLSLLLPPKKLPVKDPETPSVVGAVSRNSYNKNTERALVLLSQLLANVVKDDASLSLQIKTGFKKAEFDNKNFYYWFNRAYDMYLRREGIIKKPKLDVDSYFLKAITLLDQNNLSTKKYTLLKNKSDVTDTLQDVLKPQISISYLDYVCSWEKKAKPKNPLSEGLAFISSGQSQNKAKALSGFLGAASTIVGSGIKEHKAVVERKRHEDFLQNQDKERDAELYRQERKFLKEESIGATSFGSQNAKKTSKTTTSPRAYCDSDSQSNHEPSAPPFDHEPSAPEMIHDLPIPPGTPPPSYDEMYPPELAAQFSVISVNVMPHYKTPVMN